MNLWGLLDGQATLKDCLRLLEEFLPQNVRASDRLIFYFAGHGIALNSNDGLEGFLIPQDGRLGDTSSYLPMVRLQKALNNLPCRHVKSVAISNDGKFIVSGAQDSTVRLWNRSGIPLGKPLIGHQDGVTSVAISPDGQYIISGSRDRTIRTWSTRREEWFEVGCDRLKSHSTQSVRLINLWCKDK